MAVFKPKDETKQTGRYGDSSGAEKSRSGRAEGPRRARSRPSMRQAINNFCRWCIVDPESKGDGNWRQQVTACTSPECPLYPLRPTSSSPLEDK